MLIQDDDHFKSNSSIFDIQPPTAEERESLKHFDAVHEFVTAQILD